MEEEEEEQSNEDEDSKGAEKVEEEEEQSDEDEDSEGAENVESDDSPSLPSDLELSEHSDGKESDSEMTILEWSEMFTDSK